MPAGSRLRSISLGQNQFLTALQYRTGEPDQIARALNIAMEKLEAAAAQHRVCVRLYS